MAPPSKLKWLRALNDGGSRKAHKPHVFEILFARLYFIAEVGVTAQGYSFDCIPVSDRTPPEGKGQIGQERTGFSLSRLGPES